jgi:hypothetical protein
MPRADFHDLDDLVERRRKADNVGRSRRVIGLAVAMMLADRRGIGRTLPEQLFELQDWTVHSEGLRPRRSMYPADSL